jgi:hypothetical protein
MRIMEIGIYDHSFQLVASHWPIYSVSEELMVGNQKSLIMRNKTKIILPTKKTGEVKKAVSRQISLQDK